MFRHVIDRENFYPFVGFAIPLHTKVLDIEANFSTRTSNCLSNKGWVYWCDIKWKSGADIMAVPNFGLKSYVELREAAKCYEAQHMPYLKAYDNATKG